MKFGVWEYRIGVNEPHAQSNGVDMGRNLFSFNNLGAGINKLSIH